MSKEDKLVLRLKSIPADFTFSEARTLLSRFGYKEYNKGKTSGSRVLFYRESDKRKILLHKPHPGDIMKQYSIKDLLAALERNGDVDE